MGRARPQAAARLDAIAAAFRTFYVVRHAKAGNREAWTGDDRKRPLSKKGFDQARQLVALLKPSAISCVYSSAYLRCVQTVEPLAQARHLEVKMSSALEEGAGLEGLEEFFADRGLGDAVLSTHGDILEELVNDLNGREVIRAGYGGIDKGATWVVEVDEHGVVERARYLPAP